MKCRIHEVEQNSKKFWCAECRLKAKLVTQAFRRAHPKKLYCGFSYTSRNIHLKEIGFRDYAEYLRSALWRQIRSKVYARKGRLCYKCGNPATAIHHTRYHKNDLLGKCLLFLFPICDGCHRHIEFSKKGKKVDLPTANERMKAYGGSKDYIANLIGNFDADR